MSETVFLQALATSDAARPGAWLTHDLAPDVADDAVGRLQGLAFVAAAVGLFAGVLVYLVPALELGSAVRFSFMLPVVTCSLGMAALCRFRVLPAARLLDVGLVYQVLCSLALAVASNAAPWPKDVLLPGWSPSAVWVLAFPLVVPSTLRRTLLASGLSLLTDPFAIWILVRTGALEMPATTLLLRRLFPSLLALLVAVLVARMMDKLRAKLAKARELGSYELVERLGGGGMGEVWRAKHRMLARPAAVKFIRPGATSSGGAATSGQTLMKRFEREARATAALRSPHTIDIFDFGASRDGAFYYVMELLDGMDLDTLVQKDGPQPPARVVRILRQACHSLHEAHRAGLVHRDIKPANLFLCRYGAELDFVKVLDFGLVAERPKEGAAEAALTSENAVAGTPAFMAPEMALGGKPVDGRADLYALGCVAYWLLTGALVFEADSAMQLVVKHVTEAPVAPSRRGGAPIPAGLEQLVMACLEKDPEKRPAGAQELSSRLAALGLEEAWEHERAERWWDVVSPEHAAAE